MNNPYPTVLSFGGQAADHIKAKLAEMATENARRVPCPHCDLMILPETLERHVALCHDGDEA